MRKVKNLLLTAILAIVVFGCCAMAACKTNYKGLYFGKYYLENSNDVYIEIKDDHRAVLNNLDFKNIDPETVWGKSDGWSKGLITKEEVIASMQGERDYWYFAGDIEDLSLSFEIKRVDSISYMITFNYNGKDQLEYNDLKYIRK